MEKVEWYSWGSGGTGLLGLGDLDDHSTPTLITSSPFITPPSSPSPSTVTSLACSGVYSLACTADGGLYECGDRRQSTPPSSQAGGEVSQPLVRPTRMPFPHSVVKVACGWCHSACITADGAVWTWGDNRRGQLGLSSVSPSNSPPPTFLPQPTPLHLPAPALSIACGWRHSIALLTDHSVQGWGDNKHGQLSLPASPSPVAPISVSAGLSTHIWPPTPLPLPVLPPLAHVRDVACGWTFSLLLTSSHLVFTCGSNQWQQCSPDPTRTVRRWRLVEGLPPVIRVACGWSHCLARDEEGKAWMWGRRSMGQAGAEDSRGSSGVVEVVLGDGMRVSEVLCGSESCMAVDVEGRLWGWGWNEHGNLGVEEDGREMGAVRKGCVWTPRMMRVWGAEVGSRRRVTGVVTGGASVFARVVVEEVKEADEVG